MVIVAFKTLSEHEFNKISNSFNPIISGGGQSDINIFRRYRANRLSRGRGLLSVLSQIGRRALPFLKEWILPSAKEYGKRVLSDVIEGKTLKSSLKSRGKESLKDIGSKIGRKIMKGGASRRRNTRALIRRKKRALKKLRQRTRKGRGRPKKNIKSRIKRLKKTGKFMVGACGRKDLSNPMQQKNPEKLKKLHGLEKHSLEARAVLDESCLLAPKIFFLRKKKINNKNK